MSPSRLFTALSVVLLLCLLLTPPFGAAQTRRALVIGINTYQHAAPPKPTRAADASSSARKSRGAFVDLDGCTNDAAAMHDILVARFDFMPQNVVVLKDTQATRDRILGEFRRNLIQNASPGDEVFFFYAGHGSQVRNTKSKEQDGLDETIVPADAYLGVPDIRDKEIRRLFNEALDKGVILTAVFDCCHSGSISRGLPREGKTRFLARDPNDVADDAAAGPPPAERGALVFSAAHEFQLAGEARDEQDSAHGAFTIAFLNTLRTSAPDESAQEIFVRVKAQMQAGGRLQEPDLDGTSRAGKPLFGKGTGSGSGKVRIAVLNVQKDESLVELQGGFAVGIRDSCELRKVGSTPADSAIRLKVIDVQGLSRCTATATAGGIGGIWTGDLFEITRWAVPSAAILRVYIAPDNLDEHEIRKTMEDLEELRGSGRVHWVEDPTVESASHVLSWDGTGWKMTNQDGGETKLGRSVSQDGVLGAMTDGKGERKLFVNLPPSNVLRNAIRLGRGTSNDAIDVLKTPEGADYYLVGRWNGHETQYAWVLPRVTQRDKDSLSIPLPIRSDWMNSGGTEKSASDAASALVDNALRLGKLRAWLALDMPPEEGTFPYKLALKNVTSGDVRTTGTVLDRERYSLVLRATTDQVKKGVEPRFVYVFVIDSYGNTTLLFPSKTGGNLENRVPFSTEETPPAEIALGTMKFTISKPFGVDTYVLLTSQEALPNPADIESRGIRTRGESAGRGRTTSLSKFLFNVGAATRGVESSTPTNWSVNRLMIRSAAKNP